MSTCPTRKAVNSRPSIDVLSGNIRRWLSEQVKKYDDAKKAAAVAVKKSNDTAKHLKQEHIADLEDNLQKEDVLLEKQSVRPDLQVQNTSTLTKPSEPDDAEPEDADCIYTDSEVIPNEGEFLLFVP